MEKDDRALRLTSLTNTAEGLIRLMSGDFQLFQTLTIYNETGILPTYRQEDYYTLRCKSEWHMANQL